MPYCAKCGVEVDNNIKKCPLCDFPIPDVGQETDEQSINVFPEAENIYKDRVSIVKNKVFFIFEIILIFAIPILISIRVFYPSITLKINYIINCIIASVFYLFFLFGYLNIYYNILGIGLTSIVLTYKLDSIDNNISWFYSYAILIILLVMAILYICVFLYKRSKKENKAIYILNYIFEGIGLLCLGIDSIISYRINNTIKPSWSIIVLISSVAISLLILGLYHGLPGRVRNKIRRKLHV
ncbi:LTA synthase family protein [Vallitalea guaymasensis]|uniref:Zinc ribbon domain-containing protein n=1 Tax=Vallitalea guaymasensis TaxID=1185412 RepID=A0A8J8MBQ9_9FIRM|nr:hypothetical protein [Vallitalea guaymasensis]QUH29976.1 hypothetical protein HYG85_14065 [Vallitalea guaymasensis]